MQASGRVDQHHLISFFFRLFHRLDAYSDGIPQIACVINAGGNLPSQNGKLLHGRGPVNVRRYQIDSFLLCQKPRQFGGRRRFTAPLQTNQHDGRGNPGTEFDMGALAAHQFHQTVMHNLDDLLTGRDAFQNILADRPAADILDKILDDLEIHIRFQKRHADFLERHIDAFLIENAPSLEFLKNPFELFR